ncbi:hypothetical protein HYALB_00011980 [Hymenoscyphus albidus]|uniref:Malonyl-CoA:ACP transacylase (MAT) domain-containing protein n=1 Tax=Hymenoscyphus albidus TaxID=595503 RepID=A0A9N9PZW2_9HELO|nr:hypothetical protein HYALB_00011980 [Hymenoscyphus albidus]
MSIVRLSASRCVQLFKCRWWISSGSSGVSKYFPITFWAIRLEKLLQHMYCTGALDRRSAIKVSYYRGILTSRFAQEYPVGLGMLAVGLPENEVHQYITTTIRMFPNPQLSIGCINRPKSVTITGHEDQIMALNELLDEDHIFARKLAVKVAYHSPILKKIVPEYIAVLGNLSNNDNPEIVHMTSSVTGEATSFEELRLASYWARNLTSPVNFAQAMTRLCNLQEIDSIIEIGPHSALQAPIKESIRTMKKEDLVDYTSALARSVPATESLLNAVGRLYCRGHSMNLSTINFPYGSATPGLLHNLPEYSFDHSRTYWRESRISRDYRLRQQPFNPFLGFPAPDWNPLHAIWRRKIRLSESSWLKDHKLQPRNELRKTDNSD